MIRRKKKDVALLREEMRKRLAEGESKESIYKVFKKEGYTYPTLHKYYDKLCAESKTKTIIQPVDNPDIVKENQSLKAKMQAIYEEVARG